MCGIAGIRRYDSKVVEENALTAMADTLRHRGPDGSGTLVLGTVGFANTRLAIIDLAGSPQPMSTPSADLSIVFNGEILNFRELRAEIPYDYQSSGDTEVLLAVFERWGPRGVSKLRGQFAYAIYDGVTQDIWLFRDQVGILPLYYHNSNRQFTFASELKALLAVLPQVPDVDPSSLAEYLSARFVASPNTMFTGVKKLEPGHFMRIGVEGPDEPVRYWGPPEDTIDPREPARVVARLQKTLQTAVDRSLVADVPVGAFLSGGVDSSLIAAMASASSGRTLSTFSAGFSDSPVNELPFARRVSTLLGTRHHEVVLTARDFERTLPMLTWHRDAPISEPSDLAVFRLAQLARQHVKVALTGEGSDELFAGYPKHRFTSVTRMAGAVPSSARAQVLGRIERALPPDRSRLRNAVRALSVKSEVDRYNMWFASFTPREVASLLQGGSASARERTLGTSGDSLRRSLLLDFEGWLPDNLLERADRMSMATSLEVRPPFLDQDVVNYAFSLPSRFKVRQGRTKWPVKEVARLYLPSSIVDRQKVGFKAPMSSWFRGGLRAMAMERLLDAESFVGQVLDRRGIELLLGRHAREEANEERQIWSLLALEVWYDTYYGAPHGSL